MKYQINIEVNGDAYEVAVDPWITLNELLREKLNLTGTKFGCGSGDCGACTVILNNKAVNSCLTLAVNTDGMKVTTVEGLASSENKSQLHPIQKTFLKNGAVQCGFCTPGMEMSALHLLEENISPDNNQIREAISGNLCRCTGYTKIVEAISEASKIMNRQAKVKTS